MRLNLLLVLLCTILLISLTSAQVNSTPVSDNNLQIVKEHINRVEKDVEKNIDSLALLIKVSGSVLAIVAGALAFLGINNYRNLMAQIRDKVGEKIDALQVMQTEAQSNLKKSQELSTKAREMLLVQEELAPAALTANAWDALMATPSDRPSAALSLSQLAISKAATPHDLLRGGNLAKDVLSNPALARQLIQRAAESPNAPYTAQAVLAELSFNDPDWKKHRETLDNLMDEHPCETDIIASVANFHIARNAWQDLEGSMQKAQSACPWLALPPLNRATAAQLLRKDHKDVVKHYETALENSTPASEEQGYLKYALYLMYRAAQLPDADLEKAESLLRAHLMPNPEDGLARIELGKLLERKGKRGEAVEQIKVGFRYTQDATKRREAQALLDVWGEETPLAPSPELQPSEGDMSNAVLPNAMDQ